jgi:hypothetical protein
MLERPFVWANNMWDIALRDVDTSNFCALLIERSEGVRLPML